MLEKKAPNTSDFEFENTKKFEKYLNSDLAEIRKDLSFSSLNFSLFTRRQDIARFLFLHHLYQLGLNTHGVAMEMGTLWGGGALSSFAHFRAIYEPYNLSRRIIGFDSFSGFPQVDAKDKHQSDKHENWKANDYATTKGWESHLTQIMRFHDANSPLPHVEKFEIVKGDILETLPAWLENNQHVVVSCLYLDLDIYKPTKLVLEKLIDRMPKGAVLGFDELCMKEFPGETSAVHEVLGLKNLRLQRVPFHPWGSYAVL